jgi:hypothetical protein
MPDSAKVGRLSRGSSEEPRRRFPGFNPTVRFSTEIISPSRRSALMRISLASISRLLSFACITKIFLATDLPRMFYKQLGDSNHSGKLSPSKKKMCVGLSPVRADQ